MRDWGRIGQQRFRARDVCGDAALGADAAPDKHPAQENHDGDDRRGHEQKDQLLSVQLNLVKAVVLLMLGQTF